MRVPGVSILIVAALATVANTARAQSPLTCDEIETFLRAAKPGAQKTTAKGTTQPTHAIFDDGKLQHEAFIQSVHENKTEYRSSSGATELNFKDWWEFNVARWSRK